MEKSMPLLHICFLLVADKGFPAGEWNGYYQQASSFGDKGQLVRGVSPETPHKRRDFVCMNCCFSLLNGREITMICPAPAQEVATDEMAAQYGFSEDQKEQLAELLVDENNSLWTSVLYGITGDDGEIVSVALSQIGNIGDECRQNSYPVGYYEVYGYGVPAY